MALDWSAACGGVAKAARGALRGFLRGFLRASWGHRGISYKTYAKELGAVSSVTEQASDGGAPDIELLGDGGFARSFASEVLVFLCLPDDLGRAAVRRRPLLRA